MAISIEPLSGALGARIQGLDPDRIDEVDRTRLREAFLEYGVLVVKGLTDLTPDQHIELSRILGELAIHPIPTIRLKGHPEIIVLAADLADSLDEDDPAREEVVGQIPWHSDLTYTDSPSRGALLLARTVPPELGHTGYIDTAAVYDALPDSLRLRIEGRRAIHCLGPIQEELKKVARATSETEGGDAPVFEQVTHPLVHVHPESGRKVLNVSPAFLQGVEGLPENESQKLIEELKAFATQDRFVYMHHWEVGDLVIWDNWRTMHTATGHKKKHARRMHRTTIAPGAIPKERAA